MVTAENAYTKEDGPVSYHLGHTTVELGDYVILRGWLRKKRGVVNYVPGISFPHDEMEHNSLYWIGIQLDKGTFTGVVVEPDTGCVRKKVQFVSRGNAENLTSIPEAPWD